MRVCAFGFGVEVDEGLAGVRVSRRQRKRLNEILTKWREFTGPAGRRIGRMVLGEAGLGGEEMSAAGAAFLIAFFGTAGGHRSRAEGVYFGR